MLEAEVLVWLHTWTTVSSLMHIKCSCLAVEMLDSNTGSLSAPELSCDVAQVNAMLFADMPFKLLMQFRDMQHMALHMQNACVAHMHAACVETGPGSKSKS